MLFLALFGFLNSKNIILLELSGKLEPLAEIKSFGGQPVKLEDCNIMIMFNMLNEIGVNSAYLNNETVITKDYRVYLRRPGFICPRHVFLNLEPGCNKKIDCETVAEITDEEWDLNSSMCESTMNLGGGCVDKITEASENHLETTPEIEITEGTEDEKGCIPRSRPLEAENTLISPESTVEKFKNNVVCGNRGCKCSKFFEYCAGGQEYIRQLKSKRFYSYSPEASCKEKTTSEELSSIDWDQKLQRENSHFYKYPGNCTDCRLTPIERTEFTFSKDPGILYKELTSSETPEVSYKHILSSSEKRPQRTISRKLQNSYRTRKLDPRYGQRCIVAPYKRSICERGSSAKLNKWGRDELARYLNSKLDKIYENISNEASE